MLDIALILDKLLPGAQYGGSLTSNTRQAYEALRWQDSRPKPSWQAIQELTDYQPPLPKRQQLEAYFLSKMLANAQELTDEQLGQVMATSSAINRAFELEGHVPPEILEKAVLGEIKRNTNFPASLQPVKQEILGFATTLLNGGRP